MTSKESFFNNSNASFLFLLVISINKNLHFFNLSSIPSSTSNSAPSTSILITSNPIFISSLRSVDGTITLVKGIFFSFKISL